MPRKQPSSLQRRRCIAARRRCGFAAGNRRGGRLGSGSHAMGRAGAGVGPKAKPRGASDVAIAAGRRLEAPQIGPGRVSRCGAIDVRRRPEVALLSARAKPPCNRGSRPGAVRPGRAGWRAGASCAPCRRRQADACRARGDRYVLCWRAQRPGPRTTTLSEPSRRPADA